MALKLEYVSLGKRKIPGAVDGKEMGGGAKAKANRSKRQPQDDHHKLSETTAEIITVLDVYGIY